MNTKSLNAFAAAILFLLTATAIHAQSAYFNAITNLNPVGYWPMHEIETAAPGDIETNYGTLGLLGTGYYPDWVADYGGITRQLPGALAGDSDKAVGFTFGTGNSGTTVRYTNGLYVPLTSPLTTLNPPFTVEFWFYPTNAPTGEAIWSQCGAVGLNDGAIGSKVNYDGMMLNWANGTVVPYGYDGMNGGFANSNKLLGSLGVSGGATLSPLNQWYHVVLTCDADTNFTMYVNGTNAVVGPRADVGIYSPDSWTPISIGSGWGGLRSSAGSVDEFAIYKTNLSATDIAQHYSDGTNTAPATSYFYDVTNDNPVVYLRMDGPTYTAPVVSTWPVLTNYGSVAINGVYTPGTMPGIVPGPNTNGVPVGGLSGTNVAQFGGVSSFADAGYDPAFNPTGSSRTLSVTAWFRGNPADGRFQTIVGHSNGSWRMALNTDGKLQFTVGSDTALNSTGVYNDGNWHQFVAVYDGVGGYEYLYVDSALDSFTAITGTPITGSTNDVIIGGDPQYTNNPVGVGRQFAGQVCEVALFTNALTLSQIRTLYNNLNVAPYIKAQPVSSSVALNAAFTNTVVAGGDSLIYQWYTNGVALGGQTNASLILNPVLDSYAGTNYYVIITNNYGSVTSAVVSLTVLSSPAIESYSPIPYANQFTLYAGANPTFSISAAGRQPMAYFWYTNGVLDDAAVTNVLQTTNVQASFTNYYCVVTNAYGSATSFVWAASVIADPSYSYPQTVLADKPIDYWRLNEPDDGGGNQDAICHDYTGGNDGLYTNVYLGVSPGYSSVDPETCAEFGEYGFGYNNYAGRIQGVDFAAPNGMTTNFTVEAWVENVDVQVSGGTILSKGVYGVNDAWSFDFDTTSSHYYRFYIRTADGTVVTCTSTLAADFNVWHHLVGVCDESDGVVDFYIDGSLAGSASVGTTAGAYEAAGYPVQIGSAQNTIGGDSTLQYRGNINDVAAYNYALSANQVAAQYASVGSVAPFFASLPSPTMTVNAGSTLVIPVTVIGTPTLNYQWHDVNGGTNVITGSTNGALLDATLTVSNVPANWNGDTLSFSVNNTAGSTNLNVALTVISKPQIMQNIPSQIMLKAGQTYLYSVGVVGPTPYAYQWYNVASPIFNQTNSTYMATAGSVGSSTTYYVVITNNYGAVTSVVSTLAVVGTPTNAYATNILNLNPVGYWPMHEIETAATGDIEPNCGTLGLLGTGYYPDWVNSGAAIQRQVPGALMNDSDTATYFDYTGADGAGTPTNALYIPHTSPLATLNPPFTVECWFNANASHNTEYIWSQCGYEGLNAGNSGGGGGNVCGIQLFLGAGQTSVQFYDNGSTVYNFNQNATFGQWNHFVVTCDADTNLSAYLNGSQVGSTYAAVGKYSPDYWTPFEVGNGRGNGRAFEGAVDEVAVYTTNLTAGDINAHYTDGISGSAGAYFHDVTNDNPVIYLRMDSATYTAPNSATWPPLLNFGSVGASGVYTPGTMPGIVTGPNTNGMSFKGLSGDTNVAQLSGVSSFADAGYDPAYNPTGTGQAFSVMALFRGNPCDNRIQDIVGHSDNSWRLLLTTRGYLQLAVGSGTTLTSVNVYNDGNWHQAVAVYDGNGGNQYLYVDGVLDNQASTAGYSIPGSTSDVMIGTDPQYTNNPAGVGHQFAGQICEVALFTNALSSTQVRQLYSVVTAGTNAIIISPTSTNIVFSVTGNQLTLSWPTDHIGWTLQAQTNDLSVGIGTNWFDVANSSTTNQVVIPINLTNGSVFYRLIYRQ